MSKSSKDSLTKSSFESNASNASDASDASNASNASNASDASDASDDEKNSTIDCIRNRTNFSIVKPFHMIDKKEFDPDMLKLYIENDASPKLKLLLKNIKKLDAKDLKTTGKLYKHIIFTDVNRSAYGVKIIASGLAAYGMQMVMHPQGTGFAVHPDDKLLETKGNNIAVLISKTFYDRPLNVKIRKSIMEKYNSRPDNINGDLIRFIILDQGFKEGIDLYDVKYVHLFEPLTVPADEKQAIGRGTRFCGQKGLEFHPQFGWPLYVFKYDVNIPNTQQSQYLNVKTLFDLYLKYSNIDLRKIVFAAELDNAAIEASVDYELNRSIHTFTIANPSPILSASQTPSITNNSPRSVTRTLSQSGGTPLQKMNIARMREFIRNNYGKYAYPEIRLENKCSGGSSGGNGNIVSFTPTQDFVRNYFQPSSAYKGILFYHSVGTGKTCSAIATASSSFDTQGYTILWVTRHTLKTDIWKNMYNQVCSLDIQEKIKNGLTLPKKISSNLKYVSKNWMEPISYKQFSNMLLKKNKIYNEMVRRNGEEDPLKKTLLIIDEAHKLYSPTVAKSEKPNTDILEKMIQDSYTKSGDDSVRVLLMTATPFTEDGMEMIKLLNIIREDDKFRDNFDDFAKQYLDTQGYFTERGLRTFQDKISGYISYLNRSQDARNFAHPVIENIYAMMSTESVNSEKPKSKYDVQLQELRVNNKENREQLKELTKQKKEDSKILREKAQERIKECTEKVNNDFNNQIQTITKEKNAGEAKCKELPVKQRKDCKANVSATFKAQQNELKNKKVTGIKECKDIKNTMQDSDLLNSKLNNLKQTVKEEKSKMNEIREVKKQINATVKRIRTEIYAEKAMMKTELMNFKENASILKTQAKELKNKINDKKERNVALRKLRSSDIAKKSKEHKKNIKDLRALISKNLNKIKNMQITYGKKKLTKISQQYALAKYCNV